MLCTHSCTARTAIEVVTCKGVLCIQSTSKASAPVALKDIAPSRSCIRCLPWDTHPVGLHWSSSRQQGVAWLIAVATGCSTSSENPLCFLALVVLVKARLLGSHGERINCIPAGKVQTGELLSELSRWCWQA